jgi:hypothetical protein
MNTNGSDDDSSGEANFRAVWSSDGVTRSLAPSAVTGLPVDLPFLFAAGQRFGPYVIVRPLGKGGMGQVYEAEETDSGRRVAIKILGRGIGDDEERARFLREGQLAASLSHPNCVYVFGTSEAQGFPVIAMELAPAGTLKDALSGDGVMPVAKAVDAILQLIAGLDAAAAIGILHRDIKPSNSFVDRDGRVMVGDFGLSIARDAQEGTASREAISGTPGFASPEQLRGGALDLRSDIYSVGATLYYLLTRRAPFDAPDLATLLTRVATETAPSLAVARADIPGRLGAVVARCLAANPAERYASYAALASALGPFRSAAVVPAPLGRRFLAGVLDTYASQLPMMPIGMWMGSRILQMTNLVEALLIALPGLLIELVYYSLFEGRFGCGAGKALLNLRVVGPAQHAPGWWRALLRAALFLVPPTVLGQVLAYVLLRLSPGASLARTTAIAGVATGLLGVGYPVMLFLTARRSNGLAAMHDLATNTRVVVRPRAVEARVAAQVSRTNARAASETDRRIGPYVVAADTDVTVASAPRLMTAYDDRLHRSVWLEILPPGTPALPASRRDLGRAARARWLSGRRTDRECWDAYEAIEGQPLLDAITSPQPWSRVRHWLADLASEVAAGLRDGSLPVLSGDRIWIGADDRARLLDWPAPGLQPASQASPDVRPERDLPSAARFLYGVAAGALRGMHPAAAERERLPVPLPIPARALLRSLGDGAVASVEVLESEVSAALGAPAAVPRRRRLVQMAVCAAVPALMAVAVLITLGTQIRARHADPEGYLLELCLDRLAALARKSASTQTMTDTLERDALETYVGERLRDRATDAMSYTRAFPATARLQRRATAAERALERPRTTSAAALAQADAAAARVIESGSQSLANLDRFTALWALVAMIAGISAGVIGLVALVGALAVRGGFTLRAFGVAVVTADGTDASRLRTLWRATLTWLPVVLSVFLYRYGPPIQVANVPVAVLYTLPVAAMLWGATVAWRNPTRAVQDRLAGTWLVPR